MSRAAAKLLVACSFTAAVVLACTTDYQRGVDDPNFGAPNALAGQKQPGTSSAATPDTPGSTPGAGGGAQPACVKSNGTLIDGGACAVSFAKDVLPALGAGNCQIVGCHGGATPQSPPRVDPADGPAMWTEFAAFTLTNGKPYINPCSTDPAASAIAQNVDGTAPKGSGGVIMPLGTQGLPAAVAKITEWQKCGSPNN